MGSDEHMTGIRDLTGQKFGGLTAVRSTARRDHGNVVWVFKCDCGASIEARGSAVTSGGKKSCGCQTSEAHSRNIRALNAARFGGDYSNYCDYSFDPEKDA